MHTKTSAGFILVFSVCVGGLSSATQDVADRRGATRVMLRGPESVAQLNQVLVGQGVAGTDVPEAFAGPAGRIAWKQVRDTVDDLGMRHVLYKQVLKPEGKLASLVEKAYRTDGVELDGAEIGVHWHKDGTPRAVFGTQFLDAVILNEPTIGTAADAWNVAQTVVASWPDFDPRNPADWTAEAVASRLAVTELLLQPAGDGRSFRFVWRLPTLDAAGTPCSVVLDGQTAEVLSVSRGGPGGACEPGNQTQVTAIADPQNSSIADRTIWATPWGLTATFSHEGHRPATVGQIPEIAVYMGINDPAWATCDVDDAPWAVIPLKQDGGYPRYIDYAPPSSILSVPGRAAGDGLYFTYLTMQTLKNTFGRYGYDGAGSEAKLLVDVLSGFPDFIEYIIPDYPAEYAPTWAVSVHPKQSLQFSYSSCLDAVAHEWGHGVVESSASFPYVRIPGGYNYEVGAQLHEGFADVLGYATEWLNQPTGTGAEKADWKFAEDNWSNTWGDSIQRQVDVDDGVGGLAYHKDDHVSPSWDEGRYVRGNMLPVALRLMSTGGKNPVCSRNGALSGCASSVTGIGVLKASKTLMRVLTAYATSTTGWADLSDLAMLSAFDLFSNCSPCYSANSALSEQQAALQAFTAIGYGGAELYTYCPCPD